MAKIRSRRGKAMNAVVCEVGNGLIDRDAWRVFRGHSASDREADASRFGACAALPQAPSARGLPA